MPIFKMLLTACAENLIIIAGDFNAYVGADKTGWEKFLEK